ncbi:MAG: caspase family protein, partial [Deltaproteobacteria bacterium]
MRIRILLWTVWIGLCCGIPPAAAGNRALIVTIGAAYQQVGLPPISGPEKDAEVARSLARHMGFQENEIRLIQEFQATRPAILDGLNWVRDGVRGGDKALIYYSGHGTQVTDLNGDEADGCDEALVPVDGVSTDKCVLDDEIGQILDKMDPACMVVLVVDSCFSGTITKSMYGGNARDIKWVNQSADTCNQPVNIKSIHQKQMELSGANRVVLTATAENEVAYGDMTNSGKGSVLSQAIADVLQDGTSSTLTFQALRDLTAQRIKTQCDAANRIPHHPTLDGDPAMFRKDIRLTGASASYEGGVSGSGNHRELLERIVNSSLFGVVLRPDQTTLRVGDEIRFDVISTYGGYLNIVELKPDGEMNVIFPNALSASNQISANVKINVPKDVTGPGKKFRFKAVEPAGKSLMVAIVTQEPLNLFTEQRMGSTIGYFKSLKSGEFNTLKATLTRSLAVEPVADTAASARVHGAA